MHGSEQKLYIAANFKQLVLEKFRFLEVEFGYKKRAGVKVTLLQSIVYTNKTTFVSINFDKRDSNINVYIAPEVPGRQALDYVFDPNRFNISEVLKLRAPKASLYPQIETWRPFNDQEIEEILTNSANALKTYASDVLVGDFTILPAIKELRANQITS